MAQVPARTPWSLWLVGALALLFNAIGVYDFVMFASKGAAYLASSGMTPAQITHYQAMPAWMTLVWAIGVFGAFLASILLLLRRRAAFPVFMVSLAAFLVSILYHYVLSGAGAIMGKQMAITDLVIAALLLLFCWYSRRMSARGVLH